MSHDDWPNKPLIEVAEQLGLTRKLRLSNDPLYNIRKAVSEAANEGDKQISIIEETEDDLNKVLQTRLSQLNSQDTTERRDAQNAQSSYKQKLSHIILQTLKVAPVHLVHQAVMKLQGIDPKDFFTLLKRLTGLNQKAPIAQSFSVKSLTDRNLPDDLGFDQYLKDLYQLEDDQANLNEVAIPQPQEQVKYFSHEQVVDKIKCLGNKATGVDHLSAKDMKRKSVRDKFAGKVASSFN